MYNVTTPWEIKIFHEIDNKERIEEPLIYLNSRMITNAKKANVESNSYSKKETLRNNLNRMVM